MPKFISEIRRFAGMVRDVIKRDIPKNKYYTAENINLTPNNADSMGGATAMLGSTFAVDLGQINFTSDSQDYKAWRLPINLTSAGIVHSFTITGVAPFNITTSGATPTLRLSNFITALQAATTTIGGNVYLQDSPSASVIYIGFRAYGAERTLTESISGTTQETIVIKEFYGVAGSGYFYPLKSVYINQNLFILSTNGVAFRLGVAKKDYEAVTWSYTVLLETKSLTYGTDAILDLDGEINGGVRVSLYIAGSGYLPRVLYATEQTSWVANSCMIYYNSITANPDGFYIYDTIAQQTSLQILENYARVTNFTVNNTGGTLTAGDKQYFIRLFIGENNSSGIGVGSSIIPIFTDSLTDVQLSGDIGGEITTKSIQLTIDGLNARLYDNFELIRVNNIQGVFTAQIVNKYPITGDTQTVLDNGSSVSEFSITELATQQILIKDAKNAVIARNRLFLSNITSQVDYDLSAWAKTITVTTGTKLLDPIGATYNSVNEYMKPDNYKYLAYQEFETYRLGIQLFFKDGFVSSPYFIKDWQVMRDDSYTFALTTDNGISPTPDGVLVFHPVFGIDFTTESINGVPLNELVYGYSIVRQDCIQEIWSGLLMPSRTAIDGTNYTCGQNSVLAYGPYVEGNTEYRKSLMFLCPDLNFGTANLVPVSGDKIINYGSVWAYNYTYDNSQVGSGGSFYSLSEFAGRTNKTAVQNMTVNKAEIINFNSVGTTDLLTGVKGTTLVDFGVTTAANNRYGVNQKVIAVRTNEYLDDEDGIIPSQPSWSINYALWYKPITNKYGAENNGTYRDCGHFRALNGASTVTDTTVYGGDTFPQKTFSKFNNLAYFDNNFTIKDDYGLTSAIVDFLNITYTYYLITDYEYSNIGFMPKRTLSSVSHNVAIDQENQSIDIYFRGVVGANTPTTGTPPVKLVRYDPISAQYKLIASFDTNSIPNVYSDRNDSPPTIPSPSSISVNYGSKSAWAISFYSSNRGNYQMRYFNPANPDKNYPYQTTLIKDWMANQDSAGAMLYSGSYTPNVPATTYDASFDPNAYLDAKEPNVLVYSELKLTDSITDSYRIFKPLNRKEYPAKYGEITNTFVKDMNFLVVYMSEQVLYQALDQQQNQTNADGTVITIGDGTVVGAREQTISNIGAPIKTMATSYKNSKGLNHMTWFNSYLKKWMRYTGALDDLGEDCGIQSILTLDTDNCFTERSIEFGYDFVNDEVLMRAKSEIVGATEYDFTTEYNVGDIVYVTISGQKFYFIAKATSTDQNPLEPKSLVNYWDKYLQSNFTLAFNDKLKVGSDYKAMIPDRFFQYNELYLTPKIVPNDTIKLYEHNRGLRMYEFQDIYASLTIIFNDMADLYKTYRTFYSDINLKPVFAMIKSGDFVTYTEESQMHFIRPHWGVNVYNDATVSAGNPSGINTLNTQQPSGQLCELTLYYQNTEESRATLREIIGKMIPRPKFYMS